MTVASILGWLKRHEPAGKTVLEFDAFTDSIAHRASGLGAGEIGTMSELGKRLIAKGNTSGTLQLPDLIERPGGNTVNVAGTLAGLGDRDAVKVGMAAAGCLVRNGEAATRERLYEELAASASLWD